MRKLHIHTLIQILVFVLLVLADRISKHFASVSLKNNSDITLISNVLDLHYLENTGAAFGLLGSVPWLFYVIGGICVVILAVLFWMIFFRLRDGIKRGVLSQKTVSDRIVLNYLIAVLAAGAVGNLIDRILYGYVIDFLCVRFISFPVFNAADIFVTLSVVFLFLFLIIVYKDDASFRLFKTAKDTKKP